MEIKIKRKEKVTERKAEKWVEPTNPKSSHSNQEDNDDNEHELIANESRQLKLIERPSSTAFRFCNLLIWLDSFLWSTWSLAMGRNPMEHNVTDILFWEHVKRLISYNGTNAFFLIRIGLPDGTEGRVVVGFPPVGVAVSPPCSTTTSAVQVEQHPSCLTPPIQQIKQAHAKLKMSAHRSLSI